MAQQPGGLVVHPGVVHRAGELRQQDGAASHADPRQPHRGLRVRLLLRQGVLRLHETDALPRVHAHSLRPLPAKEAGHSVIALLAGLNFFTFLWRPPLKKDIL